MGACACGAYAFGSCVCKYFKEHCRLSFRTFDSAKLGDIIIGREL